MSAESSNSQQTESNWWKNLLASLIGLAMVVLVFAVVQYFLTRGQENHYADVKEKATAAYTIGNSPIFGWVNLPNVTATSTKYKDYWTIYEATYTFDEYRRRVVFPKGSRENKEKFLIYLGGSNMMGEGLEDQDTFDYQLTSQFPQFASYNYSVRGYGLGHVMAQAENIDFKSQIPQREGLVIYLFPTFHIDRLLGGLETIGWAGGLPHYRLEDDQLVRAGFVHSTRWLYALAGKLYSKSFFRTKYYLAGPFKITREDLEFSCRVVSEVRNRIAAHFEKMDFLLVLHPQSDGKDFSFCLDRYGIKWLDLRQIHKGYKRAEVTIKGDGHASAFGNALMVEKVQEYLKANGY